MNEERSDNIEIDEGMLGVRDDVGHVARSVGDMYVGSCWSATLNAQRVGQAVVNKICELIEKCENEDDFCRLMEKLRKTSPQPISRDTSVDVG